MNKYRKLLHSYPLPDYIVEPSRLSWVERKRLKNVGKARENIFDDGYKGKKIRRKWWRK